MESDILDGVIALFIALLILSIINEKVVFLVRSYVKQFRFAAIIVSCLLIAALWFNSELYQPSSWVVKGIAFALWVLFHFLVYFSQNKLLFRIPATALSDQDQRYMINGLLSVVFYIVVGSIFGMTRLFLWWNALLFTTLFFLAQATLNKNVLTSIAKGTGGDKNQKGIEISFLSISVGVLLAFSFHANIFAMLKLALKPNPDLGPIFDWKEFPIVFKGDFITFSDKLDLPPYEFFGILITGFFLSYGSQFFHDMLEYLLEIKNLKRTLTAGKETYDPGNIKDVDEITTVSRSIMAEKVKAENEATLKQKYPNIKSINTGLSFFEGKKVDSLIIHLKDDKDVIEEREFYYKLPSGKTITIPVEVIKNVKPPTIQNHPGVTLAHSSNIDKRGTFGCLVKKINSDDKYVLTCSHVVYEGNSVDKGGVVNEAIEPMMALGFGRPRIISQEVYYARRDAQNDTALLVPQIPDILSNDVDGTRIMPERDLDPIADRLESVTFHGAKSGKMNGYIHLVNNTGRDDFMYDDGRVVSYEGLIVFGAYTGSSWKTITEKGDSGSVLLDKKNSAIGLVIGGNDQFSYALPIKRILTQSNCTII
jgi:hypothetical protein